MKLFEKNLHIKIVLEKDAQTPVRLAAADLQKNLRQVERGRGNPFSCRPEDSVRRTVAN